MEQCIYVANINNILIVPSPTSVTVTINPEEVRSITENITLTCNVQVYFLLERNTTTVIDVTIEWFLRSSLELSQSMRINSSIYEYGSTFQPRKVGNYSCSAKVNSSSPYLRDSNRVRSSTIVGK